MANFTLSKSDLLMLNGSLVRTEFDLKETIRIYSEGNIDDHVLGDEEEPTYREEIEKLKGEIKKVRDLQQKISNMIYELGR